MIDSRPSSGATVEVARLTHPVTVISDPVSDRDGYEAECPSLQPIFTLGATPAVKIRYHYNNLSVKIRPIVRIKNSIYKSTTGIVDYPSGYP
jgi:hypothetical protein